MRVLLRRSNKSLQSDRDASKSYCRRSAALVQGLLFCLSLVFPGSARGQEPAYFGPASILKFADFLFDGGDYSRAGAEYQRYLSLLPESDTEGAAVRMRIGVCFKLSEDFPRALETFRQISELYPETDVAGEAHVQMIQSLILAGRYPEAAAAFADERQRSRTEQQEAALASLQGVNLLLWRHWEEADTHFRKVLKSGSLDPDVATFAQLAAEGLKLPRKSPVRAGILASMVPGTGRIYAGKKGEGLLSLVTFALTSWQSYRGFERDGRGSVRGWVYGSIATFLYVGNIYGSVVAVRLFNEEAESALFRRARVSIRVAFR